MILQATPPDATVFAPFGAIIDAPRTFGDRKMFSPWLSPVADLALQFHSNAVAPSTLPLTLTQVERHPHAAQIFVPMDVSRYIVTVAPMDADGGPNMAAAVCMEMPGKMGVVYAPGVWHAGVTVLDRTGHFAVLMYRGAPDDDVFRTIQPVTLQLAPTKVRA